MPRAGLTAALIWLLSPFTLLLGLRGLEISLSVLIILLLVKYLSASETSLINLRHALLAGFLVGLSGWARTDNLPVVGLTLAIVLLWCGGGTIIRRIIWALTAGITALITILPWLAWNYAHFGQIIQISGFGELQHAWSFTAIAGEMKSLSGIIGALAHTILVPITYPANFLTGEEFKSTAVSVFIVLAVCILIVWLILRLKKLRDTASLTSAGTVISFAAIYMILHVMMYGIVLRFYAAWYALPFYAMLCILIGIGVSPSATSAHKQTAPGKAAIAASFVLSVAIYAIFLVRVPLTIDKPERHYGPIFESLSRQFPSGATVGAFNAGAAGYFAPNHGKNKVVNLNLLVNNKGYDEFNKGRFLDYIAETIDVFIEDPRLAERYLSPEETEILCALYARGDSSPFWKKFRLEAN